MSGKVTFSVERHWKSAPGSPSELPELTTDICIGSLWLRDQKSFLDVFGEGQPPTPR